MQCVRGGRLTARAPRGQPRHLPGGVCGGKACAGRKRRPSAHQAPGRQAPGGVPCACAVCAWPAGAFILGFPISAILDAKYGLRAPMYVAAAVGLLNFVLILLLVPESLPAEQRKVWLPARPRSHARAMPMRRTPCPCQRLLSACCARVKHVACTRSAGKEARPSLSQPARRAESAPRPLGHNAWLGRCILPRVAGQRVHQLTVWQLRQPPLRLGAAGVGATAGARLERPSNPHPSLGPRLGEPWSEPGASLRGGRAIRRTAPLPLTGTSRTSSLPRLVRRCSSA